MLLIHGLVIKKNILLVLIGYPCKTKTKKPINLFLIKKKKYALIFNGEIFNFKELIVKYLTSENFETKSDTEVLFKLLIKFKDKVLNEIEGFFSFAFFDFDDDYFLLARDRFGIKPLYYFAENDCLYFASTFKALNSISSNSNKNLDSFLSFFLLGSIAGPNTTNKNIYQLEPGSFMINKNRKISIHNYYSLIPRLLENKYKNTNLEEIVNYLKYVIKKYSISEADKSLMLSSGIDSNILYSELNKINTYTLIFDDKNIFSESKLIKQSDNNYILNSNYSFNNFGIIDDFINEMEQPSIDGLNTYLITKMIKQHNPNNKVCLSGLGLDELLQGYKYKKKVFYSNLLLYCPKILYHFFKYFLKNLDKKNYIKAFNSNNHFKNYLLFRLITPFEYLNNIFSFKELEIAFNSFYEMFNNKINNIKNYTTKQDEVFDLLNFEFYLKDQLLKDGDNMSMSNSIELRFPFLEHNLVEMLLTFKKDNSLNKANFAHYFVKDKKILTKAKTGFSFPIQLSKNMHLPKYFDYQSKILNKFLN